MPAVLAKIDISAAPAGKIFDTNDPDTSVENKFFADWRLPLTPHKYWQRASPFNIEEEDGGGKVLECRMRCDAAMVAGDADWADYTVSARIRLLSPRGRAGVMARYKTSRHYYYFAIDAAGKAVLFMRADDSWKLLAEKPFAADCSRYYALALTVKGSRLTATLEGGIGLEATDGTYPGGPAGIRNNTRARYGDVLITACEGEPQGAAKRRQARLGREADIQKRYPREKLIARYPKPDWRHEMSRLGRVAPNGGWGLALFNSRSIFSETFAARYSSKEPARIGIATLDGKLLWSRDLDMRFPMPIDTDGDGRDEILGIVGDRMVVLSPENGEIIKASPLPASCPFQGARGAPIAPDLYPWFAADLRGTGRRSDFVIKDDRESHGGRTLWAYDGNLKPLWTARVGWPRYGHALSMCDINGDGRDEVLAGFHCFDADGNLLWKCKEAETNEDDHVDEVHLGLFGPNGEPRACGTNGGDGFYVIDATDGRVIACLKLGHVQGCSVGNYLPDRPGMDYLVGSRWGSFGILNVVDYRGTVAATWEPDNVSQGGPPVKWTRDKGDLFLLSSTAQAFGLWDGYGNRCVALDCPELPSRGFYGVQKFQGAVKDIDGDALDELIFTFPDEVFIYKSETDAR